MCFSQLSIDNDTDNVELTNGQVDVGQLKMCSKSLVFDPKHFDAPIIKIAYKHCDRIYIRPLKVNQKETNVLAVSCAQYTEMLPKNHVAPYTFKYAARTFLFHFHYAPVHEYLDQLRQLMRASKLHACEQNDMVGCVGIGFTFSFHSLSLALAFRCLLLLCERGEMESISLPYST